MKFNTLDRHLLVGIGLLCLVAPLSALEIVEFLPATGTDLIPNELIQNAPKNNIGNLERIPLTFSWPPDSDEKIDIEARSFEASSREYRIKSSAAELNKGVTIATTAPGALIRINPIAIIGSNEAFAINPINLHLVTPDGRRFASGDGMETMATAEQLDAAGAPFAEGTSAFRIDRTLGAGSFTISAPSLDVSGNALYVIHIFEPDSSVIFNLATSAGAYVQGQTLVATAIVTNSISRLQNPHVTAIQGHVVSPSGTRLAVIFHRVKNNEFTARIDLKEGESSREGLWELHTSATGTLGNLNLYRDVHTAFACAIPTARLNGNATLTEKARVLAINFEVETAAPGRYEIRGVLFGSDAMGEKKPMGIAHAASWLEAGLQQISLEFDDTIVRGSELEAPYELRELRLFDQGRMDLLQRQGRALIIQ